MRRRYGTRVGIGAAAAASLAVAGVLVPASAMADTDDGASLETLAKETLAANDHVHAVGENADGQTVVLTTDADASIEGPLADEDVIGRTIDGPIEAQPDMEADPPLVENPDDQRGDIGIQAQGNVVGGGGYISPVPDSNLVSLCSMGFTGWSPDGDPAIITAGHCTQDGELDETLRSAPSEDPAGGGDEENEDIAILDDLGNFGFSQFGGPENSEGEDGDPESVDIGVIDNINPGLTLLPEVTDWTTGSDDDLSLSTTLITSTGMVQPGEVAKSGRTTGHTTAQVDIVDGWAEISGRYVHGFGADLDAVGGDSGGAIYQGQTAVGIVSGGAVDSDDPFTWGAHLESLAVVADGYTVALHLEAPELTSHSDGDTVVAGDALSGTGPAGATLEVTLEDGEEFAEDIDGEGNWSFAAPEEFGDFEFTIFASHGFDEDSAENSYTVQVVPETPEITSPEDGEQFVTELTEITGTGTAGADIEVSGAVDAEAEVDADGAWSVDTDLGPGNYSITATQTIDDVESNEASVDFSVAPVAPEITSPTEDDSFVYDAPAEATGTGIPGAEIAVSVGDETFEGTADDDGQWTVEFDPALEPDEHTLEVTQTVGGVESAVASVDFSIVPAAPEITSPGEDESFEHDDGPTGASGTGMPGAEISVSVGDQTFEGTADDDGQWTVEFDEAPEPGSYTLEVTQTVNDQTSDAATVSFVVEPPPSGGPGELPETGVNGTSTALAGIAALTVLAGAGLVLAAARSRRAEENLT